MKSGVVDSNSSSPAGVSSLGSAATALPCPSPGSPPPPHLGFGRTRRLSPGVGSQQGRGTATRRVRSWARRRRGGTKGASPGKREPKHGGRAGRRARRESRGPADRPAPTEPSSAIYFRDLKPVPGSQAGVPMTTDVGSFRPSSQSKGNSSDSADLVLLPQCRGERQEPFSG